MQGSLRNPCLKQRPGQIDLCPGPHLPCLQDKMLAVQVVVRPPEVREWCGGWVLVHSGMMPQRPQMFTANVPSCLPSQRRVQDVISPIVFEAAYSLGEHVIGAEDRELPDLTPVLRWKKGQRIAQKNQVRTRLVLFLSLIKDPGRPWQTLADAGRKQLREARICFSP